eukprot:TRINITY_DN6238_c0_g1_i1.p1 TRINITY_DN6238_c0_g1~~TRINITY_DN6238_c0_g1_i1.p1  ORF type:complete len:105 (-),score=17.37 TRINITY_DN6238_c0_g1_i1:212-526(-)
MANHIKNKLVECQSRVLTSGNPYSEEEATASIKGFYQSYYAHSPAYLDRPELNYGGKILLPSSALQKILSINSNPTAPPPMTLFPLIPTVLPVTDDLGSDPLTF